MSNSENEWITKRAYALWEEEGYPTGKDQEHWDRASLEYATHGSKGSKPPAAATKSKSATVVKLEKPAPKAEAPKAAKAKPAKAKTDAPAKAAAPVKAEAPAKSAAKKTTVAKVSSTKAASKADAKTHAAMPEAVKPVKKSSKKVPAGK